MTKMVKQNRDNLDECIKEWLSGLSNLEGVSLQSVANHFFMSTRTVSRRLSGRGLCFKTLLCEGRKRRCVIYLEEQITIDELVCLLGLRNVSHFYKAYKVWFGHRFVEDSKKLARKQRKNGARTALIN